MDIVEALTFLHHPSAGCPPTPLYAAQTVRIQLPVCAGLITGWCLGTAIGSEGLKNNTLVFGAVHVAATIIGKSWNDFRVVSFRAEESSVLLETREKTRNFCTKETVTKTTDWTAILEDITPTLHNRFYPT